MRHHRAGRVQHHRIPDRALGPTQHRTDFCRIGFRVTANQLGDIGPLEAKRRGVEGEPLDSPGLYPPDRACRRGGQLVEAVVAVHHQYAGPASGEHPGHHLCQFAPGATNQPRPR